jgi:hypothetical protein
LLFIQAKFRKSLLSELIKIALPDVLNKFASISEQNEENGSFDNVIALKEQEETDEVCKLIIVFYINKDIFFTSLDAK